MKISNFSSQVNRWLEKAKEIWNTRIDPKKMATAVMATLSLSTGLADSQWTPNNPKSQVVNTSVTKAAVEKQAEKIGEVLTADQEKKLAEKLKQIDWKNIFTFDKVDLILERNWKKRQINSDDKLTLPEAALVLKNPRLENWNYIADVVNVAWDSILHKLEVNLWTPANLYKDFDSLLKNENWVIWSFIVLWVDFYDNKVANISLATDRINQKFSQDWLQPGQEFSYLKYWDIGQLIRTKSFYWKALWPNWTHPIVRWWGICALATGYKLAANTTENNVLKVKYSQPHSRDNYLINPSAPLEKWEWSDATAYNPSIDIILKNMSDKPLFIETGISIATDPQTPINSNWLESYSTFLVANVKVQKTPVSQQTIDNNLNEYKNFAAQRKSISSKLSSLR